MRYLFLFLAAAMLLAASSDDRGLKRFVKDAAGETVVSYGDSYALLVGVSDYTVWPDLESIPGELDNIKHALEAKGFVVRMVLDPKGKNLKYAFETFIDDYGYLPNNRLLFYYAGHGETIDDKGYLVPADAPLPNKNTIDFKRKSFNMSTLLAMARKMDAKHAIFLFDSCFSGTIFKTRALPKTPPAIEHKLALPVRQFITAGTAGEAVPARSTFAPMFIDAMNGDADMNRDGYVTGSEVGMYLEQKLPGYKNQHPQYGKIDDYRLSRGDFIFFTPKSGTGTVVTPVPSKPSTFQFKSLKPSTFSLTVQTEPADATVYITNIKPKYRDGMQLAPGSYDIKVVRSGYYPKQGSVDLRGDMVVPVTLEKMPVKAVETASTQQENVPETKFIIDSRGNQYKAIKSNLGVHGNFELTGTLKIEKTYRNDGTSWAGLLLKANSPGSTHGKSKGYLFHIKDNGMVGLHSSMGTEVSTDNQINLNSRRINQFKIICRNGKFIAYINGTKAIDENISNSEKGYISLNVGASRAMFTIESINDF